MAAKKRELRCERCGELITQATMKNVEVWYDSELVLPSLADQLPRPTVRPIGRPHITHVNCYQAHLEAAAQPAS